MPATCRCWSRIRPVTPRSLAELDVITVGGGVADVIGKGVIVHKDADDFKTQPTGNSGARVACGVVRKS